MDLKSTLYQKLSEQDKQNIKELTNKYKTSDYTLAEIFNVKSEIYKNIPLSQLCLSARVVSAIIRFKNIIDLEKLLNLTLPQIWGIKNLGEIGINELVLYSQREKGSITALVMLPFVNPFCITLLLRLFLLV